MNLGRESQDAGTPRELDARGTNGSRLSAARDWLSRRVDTSLGRLTLIWFRRYFEASRNSGAAASAYVTLSVFPTALVIIALLNKAKGNANAFAEHLISHMKLDGQTASHVHDLFGTTASNLVAASLTVLIGFLVWGVSIGLLYQDVYARAWRIRVGSAADVGRDRACPRVLSLVYPSRSRALLSDCKTDNTLTSGRAQPPNSPEIDPPAH